MSRCDDRPDWWIEYSDETPECDGLKGQVRGTPRLCVNHAALQAEGKKLRELAMKHSIHTVGHRSYADYDGHPRTEAHADYDQIAILMEMVRRPPEQDLEDHITRALRKSVEGGLKGLEWPKENRVGRAEDMGKGHLILGLDSDNDVYVTVWDGENSSTVEFCNGGGGGGHSPEVRKALIALMVAIEKENKVSPLLSRP